MLRLLLFLGPDGYVYDPDGIKGEKIDYLLELRASNNDVVKPYAEKYGVEFFPGQKPWGVKCDIAMPCATQNELREEDAKKLVANGCICIAETSNMGCTPEAINVFINNKVMYGLGRLLMLAAWLFLASKCHKIAKNSAGLAKKLTLNLSAS